VTNEKTIEEMMREAAVGSAGGLTVVWRTAARIAREHGEARARPLLALLERCKKTLAKYCPEEGSPYDECIDAIDAALAADRAQHPAGDAEGGAPCVMRSDRSRT
jgi:hypothetical protein